MVYFNTIFGQLLDSSNVKIKALAEQTGVDRASIYQYKNGKVLPGKAFLDKFISIMQLSNSEEASLREAYKIAEIGASTYVKRQQVRRCLEILSDSLEDDGQTGYIPSMSQIRLPQSTTIFNGTDKIASILKNVIDYEFALSNESNQTHDVTIQTFIPANCHVFYQHLSELYHSHRNKTIRFSPIICFTRNGDVEHNSIITALSSTMYFLFTDCPGYAPRFYYDENNFLDSIGILYPYYIITSSHLVMLDVQLTNAQLISDHTIIDAFRNRFEAAYGKLRPLTKRYDNILELTDLFLDKTKSPSVEWVSGCMASGGCMERFADNDMITRYLNPGAGDVPRLMAYMEQIKQNEKISQHLEFQSSNALLEFAKTGISMQLQSILTHTFTPVDQKLLLMKAKAEMESLGYIINNAKIKMPPITLVAIKNDCLFIYIDIMGDILAIAEPEIATAFYDFFYSLATDKDNEADILLSKEEIHSIIEESIKICDEQIRSANQLSEKL